MLSLHPMNILLFSAISAIGLYIITTVQIGLKMAKAPHTHTAGVSAPVVLGFIALVFHAVSLQQGIIVDDGLNLSFFNALSLIAWIISFMLIVGILFEPILSLCIIMFPGTAIIMLLALLFPADHIIQLQGGWPIQAHVLLSIVAYSLFALAAVQVILLTVQDKALKEHKTAGFIRSFPPLQTMEALLFQMLLLGFVLLSFSLLTGAFYIADMFAQHLIHKTILSLISWVVFGTLLWGRWKFGWRGQRALYWTLGGFVALGLAYPVTKFILEVVLNKSWS